MAIEPNVQGFIDAQAKLRRHLIPFFIPSEPTWPDGTVLDPETGRPYDPRITATEGIEQQVIVNANVIHRPFGLSRTGTEDVQQTTAIGLLSDENIGLIIDTEDWPQVKDATEFQYLGRRFVIREDQRDSMFERETRHLIVGEAK